MDEQTPVDSPSVESRLAAFFNPAPEVAPEPEAPVEQSAEAPAEAAPEPEAPETPEEPQGETFEVDGEEYILPPKLAAKAKEWKEAGLRQEDYTRKTQALAEITRQANAAAEALQLAQRFEQEVAPERGELERVKHQLSQFKQVNWSDLTVEQHLSLRQQMESLKERASELDSTIKEKNDKFSEWKDSKKREILQSGQKYLAQAIPNWGADSVKAVADAARAIGYTDAEVENVLDARFVHLAWKAAQFDKLQAAKPVAVATAQKAPPVLKPGASQGPGVAAEQKYREHRAALKKSGDLRDAARLLLFRK